MHDYEVYLSGEGMGGETENCVREGMNVMKGELIMLKKIMLLLIVLMGLSMPVYVCAETDNTAESMYEESTTPENITVKQATSAYHGIKYIDGTPYTINHIAIGITAYYYMPTSREPLVYTIDIATINTPKGIQKDIKEIKFINSEKNTGSYYIREKEVKEEGKIYHTTLEIKHSQGMLQQFFKSSAQPAIMRIVFVDNTYLDYYLRHDFVENVRKALDII